MIKTNKNSNDFPEQEIDFENRIVSSTENPEDYEQEISLRPKTLSDYVGQSKVKEKLSISMEAAKMRGEALDHILLHGPPGLGKTTLATIIAQEMGVNIRITSGPAIEKQGVLAALLTNLKPMDILFIDEIHRLPRQVEEILYPAMEDYNLDIIMGKGPSARNIRLPLPPFTLIGATTRAGQLSSPLRDRFGNLYRLELYNNEELTDIVCRSADILGVDAKPDGAFEIARRSRGTPRIANRMLKRVRDYAQVKADGVITKKVADKALSMLEVDELGLDTTDRKMLSAIIKFFDGGPVGLDTLASTIGEEAVTLEDVYEPYLMQLGFLNRTPRGRCATRGAYEHLGIPFTQVNIFDGYNGVIKNMETMYMPQPDGSRRGKFINISRQTVVNLPPRIRMATLYAISQSVNGRVANTCNLSEDWIGYSTRWGDSVGDFSPLANLTSDEVIAVGIECGLPEELVFKTPSDGLCGMTDEDNFGFTYKVLNRYIRTGYCFDAHTKESIDSKHKKNLFKLQPIPAFGYKNTSNQNDGNEY